MIFNVSRLPAPDNHGPKVGNVYKARGGHGTTKFLLLVATPEHSNQCHFFGLNESGEVVSTTSYARYYIEQRWPVGFCDALEGLNFNVELTAI